MKRIRKIQWLGLCLSCVLLLSACDQKSGAGDGESSPTPSLAIMLTATPSPTPVMVEGIRLDEAHFPDEAFRQYLYRYADSNQDRILSASECEAVTRIRNARWDHDKDEVWNDANYDTIHEGEEEEFAFASDITDLRGIEVFTNLYEVQLKGITLSEELTELVLSNPKLEIIDLSFEGAIEHIDLTACERLRYCEIRANTDKDDPGTVLLDLAGLKRIVDLFLNDNIIPTTEVVLATPTPPSPTPELPCADHVMEWNDDKLEEAMRSVTDIIDRELMLSDVYDITSLYLWGMGIEDISALAELKNLEELQIGNNKISDISALAELPNLRRLEMPENEVTDISILKASVNLERINAKGNQIKDISALAELPKLCWIAFENNCIQDISCLAGMEALECLRLSGNQITDISVISGFPKLRDVWLDNNQIVSVTDLTDLPELQVFQLNNNQITTVRLSGLQNLWAFELQDNQICDIFLSDLPELGMLELGNNCITDVSGLTSLKDLYSLGLTGNPVENIELLDFVQELNY